MEIEHRKYGETAIGRYRGWLGGFVVALRAWVVEDTADRMIVYFPAGTNFRRATAMSEQPELSGKPLPLDFETFTWERSDVLRIMYPDVPYSIWPMWRTGTSDLTGWYVNIEMPFVRTEIGFDVMDYELDIVIAPDLSWRWKDEDRLAKLVEHGVFTESRAAEFKEFGLDAVRRIESRAAPFDEPWPDWRPDPNWGPLEMPENDADWLV